MTVSTVSPVTRYICSGSVDYDFNFPIQQESDLTVVYTDLSGLITLLVLGADYTVNILEDGTGNITTVVAYTEGAIELRRVLPINQQVNWVNNSPFDMEILEDAVDKLTMLIQQQQVDIDFGNQISAWRGDWANNTDYYISDQVTDANTGNIYVCKTEHTSNISGTIQDDIALGYWALALDASNIKDAEQNAIDAAAAAAVSEANAKTSENSALDAASNALNSEQAALQSADNAEYWASQVAQSLSTVPIGHIMAWVGGYFTDSVNGGFTDVLGDPAVYLGSFGYQVCDGSEFEHASSPIFNYPGRFLPNLTDERFLMGSTTQGIPGGANSVQGSHVHTTGDHQLSEAEMPSHSHGLNINSDGSHSHGMRGTSSGKSTPYDGWNIQQSGGVQMNTESSGAHSHGGSIGSAGGNSVHNHGDTGPSGSTVDNRPQYLSVIYAMKVMYGAGPDLTLYLVQPETP